MLKKAISLILAAAVFLLLPLNTAAAFAGSVSAAAAVLYNPGSGRLLFEKNADARLSMASTTKIMTALIALEENTPYRVVTVTEEMVAVEGTSAGLRAGDKITLSDLVYCMLLESGNEAANAVALALAEDFNSFAEIMNSRGKEIGMENTSFVTPSGLDAPEHYTTARDMALLAAEAVKNEEFLKICSCKTYTVDFLDSDKRITLYNHNRLLNSYEGCLGIKTGFTKKSGRCLVTAAKRGQVVLTAVTLNAGDDWNDHIKMLDYGFSLYEEAEGDGDFSPYRVAVTGGCLGFVGVDDIQVAMPMEIGENGTIERRIYLEKFLYAPVKKGDIIGYAEYISPDKTVKKVALTASYDVAAAESENKDGILERLFGFLKKQE